MPFIPVKRLAIVPELPVPCEDLLVPTHQTQELLVAFAGIHVVMLLQTCIVSDVTAERDTGYAQHRLLDAVALHYLSLFCSPSAYNLLLSAP